MYPGSLDFRFRWISTASLSVSLSKSQLGEGLPLFLLPIRRRFPAAHQGRLSIGKLGGVEFSADLPIAEALAGLGTRPSQPLRFCNHVGSQIRSGDHLSTGIIARCQPMALRRRISAIDQPRDAEFLGHQLASEAGGVFNKDGPDPVWLDPVEQRGEAGPILDRARYSRDSDGEQPAAPARPTDQASKIYKTAS